MTILLNLLNGSFVTLFTEMTVYVMILFIVGIIFCCIEVFTAGFGVFGIIGLVSFVASLIIRMVQGGDALMALYMILIAGICVGISIGVMFLLLKNGKLKNSIFDVGTAVPTNITEGTKDYTHLVGQVGTTQNFLRPIGQARFGTEIVDVVANSGFIDKDQHIKVVSVEGQLVKVEQINIKNI